MESSNVEECSTNEKASTKEMASATAAPSSSSNSGINLPSFVQRTLKALKRPTRETLEPNLKRSKANPLSASTEKGLPSLGSRNLTHEEENALSGSSMTLASTYSCSSASSQLCIDDSDEWTDSECFYDYSDDEEASYHGTGDSSKPSIQLQWSPAPQDYHSYALPFTGCPGIDFSFPSKPSPLEVLQTFLDRDLLHHITSEANRYAWLIDQAETKSLAGKQNHWVDLTKEELLVYIGVILYMGIVRLDAVRNYWSVDKRFGISAIAPHMSYRRYSSIRDSLQYASSFALLHASQKTIQSITTQFNLLHDRFANYNPKPELFASESILIRPGKQTNDQNKDVCRFVKLYTLREAQSGYFLNFHLDTGRSCWTEPFLDSKYECLSRIEKNLCKLLKPYEGAGHILYTGVSCSSPTLSLILRSRAKMDSVFLFSSQQPERLPPDLINHPTSAGETFGMIGSLNDDDVHLLKWSDKHKTHIISSTAHSNKMITSGNQYGSCFKKPESMLSYKKVANCVAKVDQLMEPYFLSRRKDATHVSIRFFNRILNMAAHNAYVIYAKLYPDSKISNERLFRKSLINEIFDSNCHLREVPNRNPDFSFGHIITRIPRRSTGPGKIVRKNCWWHSRNLEKKDHKTRTWCPKCAVNLCSDPCFEAYHKERFPEQIQAAKDAYDDSPYCYK